VPKTVIGDRTLKTQPLWARVDSNRTKLTVFVTLFVLGSAALLALALVAVPGALVGMAFADQFGAYWQSYWLWVGGAFLALMLGGSLIAAVQLANAEDWVANRFQGRPLEEHGARAFYSIVADMTLAGGLSEQPKILVLAEAGENAFALGTVRKRAVIGITEGMLKEFTDEELRAVVATLVARIIAGDIMFGTALAALMGPIKAIRESRRGAGTAAGCALDGCANSGSSGCGDTAGCLLDGAGDSDSGCGAALGFILFAALVAAITYAAVVTAAWIVTLWGRALNRTSYEKADAEGMLLLKNPQPMISALRKAIRSSTQVADQDQSYDAIFYAPTSGTPRIEKSERRRFRRLCEVLGVDGMAASLDAEEQPPSPPQEPGPETGQ
jgi:Zn-dependent protease with chaperone function